MACATIACAPISRARTAPAEPSGTAASRALMEGSSNKAAGRNREQLMSKFKIVTPKGASFTVAGGGYGYEREALDPIGAEIVEAPANEAEFIAAAKMADAIYAKGMPITKTVIDALDNCKVITLGSVGVDSVDVKAATARGIPVTNIPDTFIEEVADHAMMLLLAGFRRLVEQDKMVRSGRWAEGRPALLKIPRLMGQTLGVISFGRGAGSRMRPWTCWKRNRRRTTTRCWAWKTSR